MRAASCELCNWFLSIDCMNKKEICENFEPVDPVEEDEMEFIKCDLCKNTYEDREDSKLGHALIKIELRQNFYCLQRRNKYKANLCPACTAKLIDFLGAADEEQAE